MQTFRYYLRRLALAPRLIAGELGFLLFALVVSVGAVEQIWPRFEDVVLATLQVSPMISYSALTLLVMAVTYRERVRRITTERTAAVAAIRPLLDALVHHAPFATDDTARTNIMRIAAVDILEVAFRSLRMAGADDTDLRLRFDEGNAGPACARGQTRVNPHPQRGKYGLTSAQYAATERLRLIISVPIKDPRDPEYVIGVLNLDSEMEYNIADPAFKAAVSALEDHAQAIAPLLELTGEVWYRHRIRRESVLGLAQELK